MKLKLSNSLFIAAMVFLAACGQAPEQTEENTEETNTEVAAEESMDHDHAAMEEKSEDSGLLAVPDSASVFFANLEDGQTVSSPLKVEFGIEGMEVEPAGELNEGKGHHHIIINGGALEAGVVVPADSVNIHFGGGQTETELELPAGEHTLTMQFADGYHRSYGEQMSATIKVIVE